jgi:hypothetical protein
MRSVLKTLALVHAPILIPALQQIARVESGRGTQGLHAGRVEFLAGYTLHQISGLLEDGHVKPEVGMRVDLHPVGLREEHAAGSLIRSAVERRLELP